MNTFCRYYNQGICHSCKKIEVDYSEQLKLKNFKLESILKELAAPASLSPVASQTIHFRNKVKLIVTGSSDHPLIGLTGETDLDSGREINDCPLHLPILNKISQYLPQFIKSCKLVPYQISRRTGELKGLIFYYSENADEIYLRFILRSKESLDRIKKHIDNLTKTFPKLVCISVNIQPIAHAILEGEEEIILSERKSISFKTDDFNFQLSPQGFVQTNQKIAEKLYTTAANWVHECKTDNFLELFSGQGAFSFYAQKFVKNALGIEINAKAVEMANQSAQINNLKQLRFLASDAAQVSSTILQFAPDTLLVNPPRRGLADAVNLVLNSKAKFIIYSSCNVDTLASDLKVLITKYQIERSQVFDMFPHTEHFETLVLLSYRE